MKMIKRTKNNKISQKEFKKVFIETVLGFGGININEFNKMIGKKS